MSNYRGKVVYIEGPKYKRSGQILHGYQYGVDWVEGFAGPFHYSGPQFNQIMAKLPGGCNIWTEDDFYTTAPGKVRLRTREALMNRRTEDMVRHDVALLEEARIKIDSLEERYILLDYYGLIGLDQAALDGIRLCVKLKTTDPSEQMSQHAARKRLLKHVGAHGWDRGRFDSKMSIKKEWSAFYSEVLIQALDGKGNILPYSAPPLPPRPVEATLEQEASILYG